MIKTKLLAATAVATALIGTSPAAVFAGEYDALCQGSDCKIRMDGEAIHFGSTTIPGNQVVRWYSGKQDTYDAGLGVGAGVASGATGAIVGAAATCWTVILCPIGFFGGMAAGAALGAGAGKGADWHYTLVGYDTEGRKVTKMFNFINKKPVARINRELPVVTGLSNGTSRSLEDIKAGIAKAKSGATEGDISTTANKDLPDSLNLAAIQPEQPDSDACWSTHLEANPTKKLWAQANPTLAAKEQANFGAC